MIDTLMIVAAVGCVVANAFVVVADVTRAGFVLENSAAVGVQPAALPYLAGLKGAGAIGLLIGFAGLPSLGLVAAVGLVLFYLGAVVAHVRAGVFHNIGFPMLFLALAVGAVAHFTGAVGAG